MNQIRVSAANLARIELDEKILLCLNKKRLQAGKRVYTPFGGALEFHEPARAFLKGLDIVFEKGNDLRFLIDEGRLPKFESWFYQRIDRESSPYRELSEELVDEEKVLTVLPENVVSLRYLRTVNERAITDRPGQEGQKTQRYFEIYLAKFAPSYEQAIKEALYKPDSHLVLVSEDEIRSGKAKNHTEIASNCTPFVSS